MDTQENHKIDIRFMVLKHEDINKLPDAMLMQLHVITEKIREIRESHGKDPDKQYLVIDSEEKWSPEIIQVLKNNKSWG